MTEKSLLGNRVPFMREHTLDCANPFRLAQWFFSALIHVADLRNSMWYNMNVLRMYTHLEGMRSSISNILIQMMLLS